MKAIIVFCMLLMAMPVFAGTYRDDFENEQDFINDCKNGVWIEDIDLFKWEDGAVKSVSSFNGADLITGNWNWKDYTIECKVKPIEVNATGIGLLLRRTCTFCSLCYYFALTITDYKNDAGIYRDFFIPLNTSAFELEMGRWYSLKAIANGNKLEFYIDNKPMVASEDDTYPAGKSGFCVFGTAIFDDFVMTGPDIKDGGHWNPKAHDQISSLEPKDKLTTKWGEIRRTE